MLPNVNMIAVCIDNRSLDKDLFPIGSKHDVIYSNGAYGQGLYIDNHRSVVLAYVPNDPGSVTGYGNHFKYIKKIKNLPKDMI